MTKTYTAADFANARFAEHEDGRLAIRSDPSDPGAQWLVGPDEDWLSDYQMSSDGWVPVPTKPTIKQSVYDHYRDGETDEWKWGFGTALSLVGAVRVPDPEPTNTDRLAELLYSNHLVGLELNESSTLAEYLNDLGVTITVKGN